VCASDPEGEPLIKAFNIEIKRGYSRETPLDMIDRGKRSVLRKWDEWLFKVKHEAVENNRPFWMVIHQRDYRCAMVWFSRMTFDRILGQQDETAWTVPTIEVMGQSIDPVKKGRKLVCGKTLSHVHLIGVRFEDFLYELDPETVCALVKAYEKRRKLG